MRLRTRVAEVVVGEDGDHHQVGAKRADLVLQAQGGLVGTVAHDAGVDRLHLRSGLLAEADAESGRESLLHRRELPGHEGVAVDEDPTVGSPSELRPQEALAVHGDEKGAPAVLRPVDEEPARAGDEGMQIAWVQAIQHAVDRAEAAQVQLGQGTRDGERDEGEQQLGDR